jgi:hypothetical protein
MPILTVLSSAVHFNTVAIFTQFQNSGNQEEENELYCVQVFPENYQEYVDTWYDVPLIKYEYRFFITTWPI